MVPRPHGRAADRPGSRRRAAPSTGATRPSCADSDSMCPPRPRVIAEGVHAATVRHAAATSGAGTAVGELRDRLAALPERRRGLPLVLTAGRLHPGKGMDRIARAWAGDAALRAGTNLVVVGGDLEQPSPDELDVLLAIEDAVQGDTDGLVLLGHRPHLELARLFAAASQGTARSTSPAPARRSSGWRSSRRWPPDSWSSPRRPAARPRTSTTEWTASSSTPDRWTRSPPGCAPPCGSSTCPAGRRRRRLGSWPRYTIEEMAANLADLYTDVADHSRRRSPCGC